MAAFFIVLLSSVVFLMYFSWKYANPYKTTFIFGKKGAGKSLLLVHYMLKYRKRGWTIYTDMKDIRIPGVRIIDSRDLSTFRPVEGSAIFLDEVGVSMDNRAFKSFPPGLRDFFKYSRKMKCVVFMNSQAFDVDKKVRDTTDKMILQVSIANCIALSRPIRRSITLTEPSAEAESRIADRLAFASIFNWKFLWMPKYFKYFNSQEMPARQLLPYSDVSDPIDMRSPVRKLFDIVRGVIYHATRKVRDYLS